MTRAPTRPNHVASAPNRHCPQAFGTAPPKVSYLNSSHCLHQPLTVPPEVTRENPFRIVDPVLRAAHAAPRSSFRPDPIRATVG